MRVLVTGGGGFIGRHLLPQLLEAGHEVHACHIEPKPPLDVRDVRWQQVDLHGSRATEWVRSTRADAMVHLGWYATHGLFWRSTENLQWIATSLHLLRAFVEAGGRRFVGAGSCAEYDWTPLVPLSEATASLRPASLYGTSKDALRRVVEAYAAETRFSWAWGRVFFLYGPHEDERRFVPSVIRALLRGENARCSHGRQIRDFMYVDDVARAFAALLSSDVIGPVNIASGKAVSLREVAYSIKGMVAQGDVELGAIDAPANDPEVILADVDRLQREVGFSPRYGLEDGLRMTIEWVRGLDEPERR